MDMQRFEMLKEAYGRNLLPDEQKMAFEELLRRQSMPKEETPTDWLRVAAQTAGGMAGGALAAPSAVVSGPVGPAIGTGLGAAMGGEVYDLARQYLGGKPDARSTPQRVMDAANEVGLNAVAGPMFEAAGGLLGSMVRPVKNALTGAGSRATMDAFQQLGITPTAGAVSGSRPVQAVEKTLGGMFGSGRIMQEAGQKTAGELAQVAENVAGAYGPVMTSSADAGASLKQFANNAIKRIKDKSGGLYEAVGSYFSPEESVPIGNTVNFLKGELDAYAQTPALGERFNKGIKDIYTRLAADSGDSGVVPFQTLQRLRSDIGGQLGDAVNAVDDLPRAQLKRLYGALSDDLAANAVAKGPEAQRAFELANQYYQSQMQRGGNIPALERIITQGLDKQAWEAATAQQGAYLPQLRQNFLPEEWNLVSGTVLGRMGRATPGKQDIAGEVFSPSTFLKNWNTLAPEAKDVLFGGTRYEQLKPQLDRLLKVVGALKDSESMLNTSGTAPAVGIQALIGGLGGGLMTGNLAMGATTVGGAVLAPNLAARLMTNPRFIQWLADGATMSAGGAKDLGKHLTRLAVIGTLEPKLKDDINAYLDSVGYGKEKK